MHGTSPASLPLAKSAGRSATFLVLTVLLAGLLAGCSQAPLAADAEPDRPSVSSIERIETAQTSGLLTFTAGPAPGADRLCLLVGRDTDEQDMVTTGSIFLVWDDQTLTPGLRVDAVGSNTATTEGGSPLVLEWNEGTGPASLPFLVVVSLSEASVAIEQELAFLVQVESSAPAIEVMQGPCP